jgi:hypothetical protein
VSDPINICAFAANSAKPIHQEAQATPATNGQSNSSLMLANLDLLSLRCNGFSTEPGRTEGFHLAMLIVTGFAGIFLGLHHQVLVLIPVTLGAAIICGLTAILDGQGVLSSLSAVIIPAVALQGGYMIGMTGRDPIHQLLVRISGGQSKRA